MANSTTPVIQINEGNVGISTSTPNAKLDVQGTQGQLFSVTDDLSGDIFSVADISGVPIMNVNSDGTSYFDGTVEIGTSTVATANAAADDLWLRSTGSNGITISSGNAYTGTIFFGDVANAAAAGFRYNHNTGDMAISAEDNITFACDNVGIGTTNPLHPLSIESASSPLIKIRNTTNAGGAAIEFNDNAGSSTTQNGRIVYRHSDSQSQGGGSTFELLGENDQTLQVLNNGRIVVQKSGSATEVGYGFYDDINTGMYRAGADTLAFSTAGNNRLHIDSSGNVGIGTTSPGEKLTVSGNGRFSNGSAGTLTIKHNYGYLQPNWGIKLDGDTGTTGGYLSQYINLGGFALEQGGTYYGGGPWKTDANSTSYSSVNGLNGQIVFYTNTSLTANTAFNPSERMRINSSGNVGIGTTFPQSKLEVAGNTTSSLLTLKSNSGGTNDAFMRFYNEGTGPSYSMGLDCSDDKFKIAYDSDGDSLTTGTKLIIDTSGNATFTGTVTAANFILNSDERKKTKIKDLICSNINVNWKSFELKEDEGEYRTGVIAQELEKSHPEFVNTDAEGFKSVKYIDLLIAKIAELEARLEKAGL